MCRNRHELKSPSGVFPLALLNALRDFLQVRRELIVQVFSPGLLQAAVTDGVADRGLSLRHGPVPVVPRARERRPEGRMRGICISYLHIEFILGLPSSNSLPSSVLVSAVVGSAAVLHGGRVFGPRLGFVSEFPGLRLGRTTSDIWCLLTEAGRLVSSRDITCDRYILEVKVDLK